MSVRLKVGHDFLVCPVCRNCKCGQNCERWSKWRILVKIAKSSNGNSFVLMTRETTQYCRAALEKDAAKKMAAKESRNVRSI